MKYKCLLFFLLFTVCIHAQTLKSKSSYDDFLKLNSAYTETEGCFLINQTVIKYGEDLQKKSSNTSYCIFHKNGQCVRLNSKNKIQYFFSSNQGYWLYNKDLKTPLKISGSYKIEEFEVQDILKINFKEDYKLIKYENNICILEKQTKKPAYKFVLLQKIDDNTFELQFTDIKQIPIRKFVYHAGSVDGFPCFKQIDVYNLVFDKNAYSSWITNRIEAVYLPDSIFSFSQIRYLTQKMENIIKNIK